MKIWTIEHRAKIVSYATEQLAYQYVATLLIELINDRSAYRYDPKDPFNLVLNILVREKEYKLAYEFYEKYKSHSGISIKENDLLGHVME
jgi:hypothetical protein